MNIFDLIFTTKIPESLRYQSFTWRHAVLLLIVSAGIFTAVRHMRGEESDRQTKLLKIFTWALPCMYLFRFIVFLALDLFVEPQMSIIDRLPFHLCAMNAIVMPTAVLTGNKTLLNYIYAVSLPGAAAAMLTPAMSYYGLYAWFSWQIVFFFIDHGLMVLVPILAISGGSFRPDYRQAPKAALLLAGYAACMYVVNRLSGQNFMFLLYPDEGTVMSFFAGYFGNPGYLLPMAVLVAVLISLMYLPWLMLERRVCHKEPCDDNAETGDGAEPPTGVDE